MRRTILLALPTLAALLLPAHHASSAPEPSQEEFAKLLESAEAAFQRKDFIDSATTLQQGIMLATGALRTSVLEAMPVAPRGYLPVAMPQPRIDPADPIAASVALNPNRPIEQRYRRAEGGGEIRVLVAPNSPVIRAARAAIARVDEQPGSEIVETGTHTGILTHRPSDFSIRFVLGDAHLVEVRAFGIEPAEVQAMLDAVFLDRITLLLGS